ncbi:hypothetical protein PIB30_030986 [Stylosanthes scabra]|uniref:DUF4283 domain-containing protein n=1 Tax=Stylosanthes scabra TaxID=79078 RepID=A0ABU6UB60_9FABA|nr:hypothetical protein [Stylosanthes scabra]
MGVLIHAWSVDTFNKIAKALDGKLITLHYLTGEKASFSVVRILIDYFQWEPIQEWMTLKCDDHEFEVYAKEFGGEVLSWQVHPKWDCPSRIGETQLEAQPNGDVAGYDGGDDVPLAEDPIANAIINSMSIPVPECVRGIENGDCINLKDSSGIGNMEDSEVEESGHITFQKIGSGCVKENVYWADPMTEEVSCAKEYGDGLVLAKPNLKAPSEEEISSSNTCPFPPGFGPCGPGQYIHRILLQGTHTDPKPTLLIDFSPYSQKQGVMEPQHHVNDEIEKTKKLFEEGGVNGSLLVATNDRGCDGLDKNNMPCHGQSDTDSGPFPTGFGPCTSTDHTANSELDVGDDAAKHSNPKAEEDADRGVDEVFIEAVRTKQICEIGGITFRGNVEVNVLAKIAGEKTPTKKRCPDAVDSSQNGKKVVQPRESSMVSEDSDDVPLARMIKKTPKKQKQNTPGKKGRLTMSVQTLGGRNLSAKYLRSGAKSRSK